MSSIPEQLTAAAKAHFETQFQLLNTLTSKAFEGVEKVIELNMDAARTSLDEASSAAREMSSATDPQALLAASAAQVQPNAEKTLEYNRQLAEIGESIYTEFSKAAEAQVAENRAKLAALIEEAEKNAPPGSENAIAIMKSILSNADAGFEQGMKNATQAVEALKTNLTLASRQFTQAAEDAAKAGRT
jgi:phasin family protein